MANTNAPFGFRHIGRLPGAGWDAAQAIRRIAAGNAVPIFFGDPVTSLNTGYVAQSVAGTTQIHGIFAGCKYLSTALGRTVWSRFWPGSGATGDVEAYVINDPFAVFQVQATSTAIGFTEIDANVQFALGAGNTVTGLSTATVDTPAVTATLPFRVIGLQDPALPGGDVASTFNIITVTFNFQDFKSTTGIQG